MELAETSKLKRNKQRLKEYIWKNLKKWKKSEEKYGYRIIEEETDNELRYYRKGQNKMGDNVKDLLFRLRFTDETISLFYYEAFAADSELSLALNQIAKENEKKKTFWGYIIPFQFANTEEIEDVLAKNFWVNSPGDLA